ncbi:hypothetical protein CN203_10925 [Sinorhizobium meliloti]|uniref:DUF6119 family protein n=1 Tax=Rhizobium meliloti TaxID=382 RepID=UPI000FDAE617|nr:DUF6119 family protein [Sinorhizobium meliloti]RVH78230.1 hypothetical protein CN203_10925 [Sinorhizobium meliloti]
MADGAERELTQISIYLAKPETSFEDALEWDKVIKKAKFTQADFNVSGTPCRFVYFESEAPKVNPPWLDFANEQLKAPIVFAGISRNANALLGLTVDNRQLIAAFGRSASALLQRRKLERDFGIRTAMNLCGNEGIRQTRTQTQSLTPTLIDRQVGQPTNSFVFGLSEAEDLKSMAAHLKDNPLITLQGRDHLTFKGVGSEKLTWDKLIEHSERFLAAYAKNDFAKLFPNYRNFKAAEDEDVEVLDAELLKVLQAGDVDQIMLWIPEFLAAEEFSFSYSDHPVTENHIYAHLDPVQLKAVLKLNQLTIKKLHDKRIWAYSHADERVLSNKWWSLYDCIIFEQTLGKQHFILTDGEWKFVAGDFYKSVVDFVGNEVRQEPAEALYSHISIFDPKQSKNREGVFNDEACKRRPQSIKFDTAKLRIGAGRKDKEFCDILDLTDDGVMRIINCKPYGGSSSISYLFAQTRFYCESFVRDQALLTEVRKHIGAATSPTKQSYLDRIPEHIKDNSGSGYRVCLWILWDKKKELPTASDLPFMAQYELKLLYDQLQHLWKFRDIVLRFVPVATTPFMKAVSATKPKKQPAPV